MKKFRGQLKPSSTKAKIEYIFDYYSFHIFAVIVIVVFLLMGFYTFTNQTKEILAVRVVGTSFNEEAFQQFNDQKIYPVSQIKYVIIDVVSA